jgi:hypothetical protein
MWYFKLSRLVRSPTEAGGRSKEGVFSLVSRRGTAGVRPKPGESEGGTIE